jgi:hypothetical protein
MVDPTLDTGIELSKGDFAATVGVEAFTKMAGSVSHLARFYASVGGIDDKTEPRNATTHWHHLSRRLMDDQSQAGEAPHDGTFPSPKLTFAVTENRHVIYITEIGGAAQLPLYELIERMQVAVGPELGGKVTNG